MQNPSSATTSKTLSTLTNGTWHVCITASDAAGNTTSETTPFSFILDTVAPSAPATLAWPGAYASSTSASLSWTNGTDGVSFSTHNVKACTSITCATGCLASITSVSSPTTLISLVNGSTYYGCVQSVDSANNTSAWVATAATLRIDTTNPTAPASITVPAYSLTTSMTFTYTNGTDANFSTHNIKACTSNNCSTGCSGTTTDTSSPSTISSLSNGSSYYACVQSIDLSGRTSSWVASAGTTTIDTTPPTAPTPTSWLQSSPYSGSTPTARWNVSGSGDVASQQLSVYSNSSCTTQYGSTITGLSNSANSYNFTVSSNGTYWFKIRAIDNAGNQVDSTCVASGIVVNVPVPPTVSVGADRTEHGNTITLHGTVTGGSTYLWSVVAGNSSAISFGTSTQPSTTVTSSAFGTYTIRLTATNVDGSTDDDIVVTFVESDPVIFTTSTAYTGNLGGISGADSKCVTHATAGSLGSNFVALVSTGTTNAKSRFNPSGNVFNINNDLIQNNLWGGSYLSNPIIYDEYGNSASGDNSIWTGTDETGFSTSNRCSEWTTSSSSISGSYGNSTRTSNHWMYQSVGNYCNNLYPIYCAGTMIKKVRFTGTGGSPVGSINLSYTVPPVVSAYDHVTIRAIENGNPPANCTSGTLVTTFNGPFSGNQTNNYTYSSLNKSSSYSFRLCAYDSSSRVILESTLQNIRPKYGDRVVFVTSTTYNGNLGGISGADAKCAVRAAAASLGGIYKAFASISSISMKNRFPVKGADVVRNRAGQTVATGSTLWINSGVTNAVGYDEFGNSRSGNVWTGTSDFGAQLGYNCSNWTTSSSSLYGAMGNSGQTNNYWTYMSSYNCNNSLSIYCISD